MESVSRSFDGNAALSAGSSQQAEVIWLASRARLADRIARGAEAIAAAPATVPDNDPATGATSQIDPSVEPAAVKVSDSAPPTPDPTPQHDEPAVSADRIVTLIREQQELIGRILQGQDVSGTPPSADNDAKEGVEAPQRVPSPDQSLDLRLESESQQPSSIHAELPHEQLLPLESQGSDPIEDDRPPMIIERAQASQGMQLIGDLATRTRRPRPTWPGFVAGMALAVVLGAVLYAKLAPSV